MIAVVPSIEEFNQALQNPRTTLLVPELKACKVKQSNLTGLPIAMCGGFALTYTLTDPNGQKWALRCFHKGSTDLQKRYDAISQTLSAINSPYFVPFQYHAQGINVGGAICPVVVMKWAQGETLGQFLENYHDDPQRLENFLRSLRNMTEDLKARHIAHGDLQPGNITVSESGSEIQLIDYDGMYVPALASAGSRERGHANFQHPQRLDHWSDRIDNFSLILLDLMTQALIKDPSLWEATGSDFDKVLLSANDFLAPEQSKNFQSLQSVSGLDDLVSKFKRVCEGSFDDIPDHLAFINDLTQYTEEQFEEYEEEQAYVGAFPVLSALDFDAASAAVGDVVELIGKVVEIKEGKTRGGKPYFFVNFKAFNYSDAVTLAVWSNSGLNMQKGYWDLYIDKWISVTGLLQPKYTRTSWNGQSYSTVSIYPTDTTNLKIIEEDEALFRLGKVKRTVKRRRSKPKPAPSVRVSRVQKSLSLNADKIVKPAANKSGRNSAELAAIFAGKSGVKSTGISSAGTNISSSVSKGASSSFSKNAGSRRPAAKPSSGLNDHLKAKFASFDTRSADKNKSTSSVSSSLLNKATVNTAAATSANTPSVTKLSQINTSANKASPSKASASANTVYQRTTYTPGTSGSKKRSSNGDGALAGTVFIFIAVAIVFLLLV